MHCMVRCWECRIWIMGNDPTGREWREGEAGTLALQELLRSLLDLDWRICGEI